jgi:glutamyl-tRNA(Gln) amidotransferase subunit D
MPEVGDRVRVERGPLRVEGILLPSTTGRIVVKLDSGYNVGILPDANVSLIKKMEYKMEEKKEIPEREELPSISIISTGGTISSRVDYRTGAVASQFSAREILEAIPELAEIARIKTDLLYNILSENMLPTYWVEVARKVAGEIRNGAYGVIVTHGTDTMIYTSSALSFMLEPPVPVVLVGSQRSSDRPSSDSAMNAICAARVALSDVGEVVVVMHGSSSDSFCLIHRGTRCRKMHTSRRDAFQTIGETLGRIDYPSGKIQLYQEYRKRGGELKLRDWIEPRCALVKFYPGLSPEVIDYFVGKKYKGLVIEGTGLGHVASEWIPSIRRSVEAGVPVVMTSQCLYGRICNRVYDTGRDLLRAGVIEGEDMIPEVALVKLMWVLGKTSDMEEVRMLMRDNICGEFSRRSIL